MYGLAYTGIDKLVGFKTTLFLGSLLVLSGHSIGTDNCSS